MMKSKNEQVQKFLDEIEEFDIEKFNEISSHIFRKECEIESCYV